jgi:hypothetical protein
MVGLVVQLPQFLWTGCLLTAKRDPRTQGDLCHGQPPRRILRQDQDHLIMFGIHEVPLAGGDRQERQYVAA